MRIDWAIGLSDILQLAILLAGGIAAAVTLANGVKALSARLDKHDGKFTALGTKLDALQAMMITQAKHDERITNLSERVTRVEGRVYKD